LKKISQAFLAWFPTYFVGTKMLRDRAAEPLEAKNTRF
jgi:hypothetical protein